MAVAAVKGTSWSDGSTALLAVAQSFMLNKFASPDVEERAEVEKQRCGRALY